MSKSKTINLVCYIALALMLVIAVVIWVVKASEGRKKTLEVGYESLFDKSYVHTINIEIDDWESFIATATNEEYVACNVIIDGDRINSVGIRAKGNTSLSSVASLGSEKYSFKIEFDQYIDGRLYKGLDKLSLNNLIYDATMMKDYLAYTLMGEMDVPSPLCSYVEIQVNGESWGLYLAVEGVEDGFLERNNMTRGELYKPDSLNFGGGRGNGGGFDFENFRVDDGDTSESSEQPSANADMPQAFSQGGMSFPGGDFSSFMGGGGQMPSNMPSGMPTDMQPGASMPSGASFGGSMPSGMSMPTGGSMPKGFSGMTPPDGADDFSSMDIPSGDFPSEGGMNFSIAGFAGNFNFGMGSSDVKLAYIDDDPDSYSSIFDSAKTVITKADKKRLINSLKNLSQNTDIEKTVYTDEVIRYLAVHDFLQNSDSYTGMMVHNYYLYEENGQLAIIPWDYNLAFGGMNGSDGTSLVNSPIDNPVASGSTSDRPLIAWIFTDEEYLEKYHEIYSTFVSEYIESGWLEAEITRVAEMIRSYVEADENSFYDVDEFDQAVATLKSYCELRGESIRGQLDGTIPSTTNGQRSASSSLVDASDLNVSSMGSMGGGGGNRGGFGGGGFSSSRSSRSSSSGEPQVSQSQSRPSESSAGFPGGGFSRSSTGSSSERQSSGRTMPDSTSMPEGFSGRFPGSVSSTSKSTWIQVGIYVLVLLAAIVVVWRLRKHND